MRHNNCLNTIKNHIGNSWISEIKLNCIYYLKASFNNRQSALLNMIERG